MGSVFGDKTQVTKFPEKKLRQRFGEKSEEELETALQNAKNGLELDLDLMEIIQGNQEDAVKEGIIAAFDFDK